MSQQAFGLLFNVHFSLISLWELNRIVPPMHHLKILREMGVQMPDPMPTQPFRHRLSRSHAGMKRQGQAKILALRREIDHLEAMYPSEAMPVAVQDVNVITEVPAPASLVMFSNEELLAEVARRLQAPNLEAKNAELRRLLADRDEKLERIKALAENGS